MPAFAAESLDGRVGTITAEDWTVSGLDVAIELAGSSLRGVVRIGTLELLTAGRSFEDILVDCGRIALSPAEFSCLDASFTIGLPGVGRRTFPGAAHYNRRTGAVRFELQQIAVADGEVSVRGTASETAVDIDFNGDALQLAGLADIAAALGLDPDGFTATGVAELSGSLATRNGALAEFTLQAELSDTSLANDLGTIVTASAHAGVDVAATRAANGWRFTAAVTADAGEAYIEPVYANLGENTVTLSATGITSGNFLDLELTEFSLLQGSLLDASGNLHVLMPETDDGEASVSGTIELADSSVHAIYSGLLQVMAAGTLFGDLDTAGTVSGAVRFNDNQLTAADIEIEDLVADDRQGRFSIKELNGTVHWPGPNADAEDAEPSVLHWGAASAYDIPLGGARLTVRLGGDDLELLRPLRIPSMGGALGINRLSISDFGSAHASGLLDAELEPIQLGQLTAAFGWPAFSGSLSGELPLLQYNAGVMTVGGTLTAKAFDGDIEFANLRLEQPFGLVPRLYGDLRLRNLDLELVTNTFSFGLIQGRLSGDVTGLEMVAWRPVKMDLHLYTPPGDTSRRRISQRAVENLASVGGSGGAAMALSSGFMKFFDEFAYEKIGIRCVLEDGICAMSGAGPAGRDQLGGGYYIVKGSGLPRIDVVGYRSQVSWSRLVRQLENIMASGAPVVE